MTLLDLLLPARCAGCRAPGSPCCERCRCEFGRPLACGLPLGVPAYALAAYRGAARQLVLSYKERGRRDLAPPLGRLLADGCRTLLPAPSSPCPSLPAREPTWLVPAPSRARASRVRGGPHMQRLAEHCAAALAEAGQPAAVAPALRLAAGARDAVGLDATRRAANLAGHVLPDPAGLPPSGSAVVLLDDVLTTGATAAACIRALATVDVHVAAVLALTSPRAAPGVSAV